MSHSIGFCAAFVLSVAPLCVACDKNGAGAHEGADAVDAAADRVDAAITDKVDRAAGDKAASLADAATAAAYKPGEMTCEDFVALADVQKPKVVYWAEGFDKRGKPADSVVDVERTDKLVPVVVADCTKMPKELLSKAVQRHTAAAVKPAATAPVPMTMTCDQFVALEDFAKPKLLYWAMGFNSAKDGGPTGAVFDIAETDSLVPVIVTDCKETPKLTLWQKIERYF